MTRLELPDDGWAEIRAPRKVKERDRNRYLAAIADLSSATVDLPRKQVDPGNVEEALAPAEADLFYFRGEHMDLANAVTHQLVLALVAVWSYGPTDLDTLGDLPGDAYDMIVQACLPLARDMTPRYGEPVPKAPTDNSSTSPTASSTAAATSATSGPAGTS